MIKIIVGMDESGLIGSDNTPNGIPWKNKEDMEHFKKTTEGKTILMGRKTYEKIRKPLPNRKTIVVSSLTMDDPRVEVSHNLQEIFEKYKGNKKEDLYVCGGSNIYEQSIPYADELIISIIPGIHKGNVYFPFDFFENLKKEKFELVCYKKNKTFSLEKYKKI